MVTPQPLYVHKLPRNRISQQSPIRWQMVYFYVDCIHFRVVLEIVYICGSSCVVRTRAGLNEREALGRVVTARPPNA